LNTGAGTWEAAKIPQKGILGPSPKGLGLETRERAKVLEEKSNPKERHQHFLMIIMLLCRYSTNQITDNWHQSNNE